MNDFLRNVRMREFEFHEWLDHKLEQVRLEEREACANLCYKDKENNIVMTHGTGKRLDMLCAAAIRARGETK